MLRMGFRGEASLRVAIVGSGIAGLGAARLLHRQGHAVTLFEAAPRAGGHAATVDVAIAGRSFPVDTGFLVYNERTYPRLVGLFRELGVESVASEMSFSCRAERDGVEWAGSGIGSLFAQPRNAARPAFWGMLADIVRFNREASALAGGERLWHVPLGDWLDAQRYGAGFRNWYLLPMAAAIWSSPRRDILRFPLPAFLRFCRNHGLLRLTDRPRWRTVRGGARIYVERIVAGLPDVRLATPVQRVLRRAGHVTVVTHGNVAERFDEVVLACHSNQSRAILADRSPREDRRLASVRYQTNRAVLHTDETLLPRARRAWSAWNCLCVDDPAGERPVAVSYLINKLQPLPLPTPVIVTLNPPVEPRNVLGEFVYEHPLLDATAIAAQRAIASEQGARRTWFAGAWMGYGFHEDGLASAHAIADAFARGYSSRRAAA
ncbi:MAG: FAD-dependent oxidoreductase [Burkholderiales bacterium]|nr:FAD-dependent oxidoreductase [Burkholderiales bacterium]